MCWRETAVRYKRAGWERLRHVRVPAMPHVETNVLAAGFIAAGQRLDSCDAGFGYHHALAIAVDADFDEGRVTPSNELRSSMHATA